MSNNLYMHMYIFSYILVASVFIKDNIIWTYSYFNFFLTLNFSCISLYKLCIFFFLLNMAFSDSFSFGVFSVVFLTQSHSFGLSLTFSLNLYLMATRNWNGKYQCFDFWFTFCCCWEISCLLIHSLMVIFPFPRLLNA
jgi:hypothetical protein